MARDTQAAQRLLQAAARTEPDSAALAATVRAAIQRQLDRLPEKQRQESGNLDEYAASQVRILRSSWMRFVPAIRAALERGGNRDVTVKAMPGLNHLFQTSATGAVAEYATIEETFAPAALEEISGWIGNRTRGR
jgi:hypothetical protein